MIINFAEIIAFYGGRMSFSLGFKIFIVRLSTSLRRGCIMSVYTLSFLFIISLALKRALRLFVQEILPLPAIMPCTGNIVMCNALPQMYFSC